MRVRVLAIPEAGKARAIREGERHASIFPRFFVDADVEISGRDLAKLASRLTGSIELISPRARFDLDGASRWATAVHLMWLRLPYSREAAFQGVLGVSEQGRRRWGEMPDLLADDIFIASHFPPSARALAEDVAVLVRPPRTFAAIVGVRRRFNAGHRQLAGAGITRRRAAGQKRALLLAMLKPRLMLPAAVYVVATLAARLPRRRLPQSWYRDETSRR
jgi:hypothetical protein